MIFTIYSIYCVVFYPRLTSWWLHSILKSDLLIMTISLNLVSFEKRPAHTKAIKIRENEQNDDEKKLYPVKLDFQTNLWILRTRRLCLILTRRSKRTRDRSLTLSFSSRFSLKLAGFKQRKVNNWARMKRRFDYRMKEYKQSTKTNGKTAATKTSSFRPKKKKKMENTTEAIERRSEKKKSH